MKFLCINTAGQAVEIALYIDGKVECFFDGEAHRASECLLIETDKLLSKCAVTLKDLDFFACVIGPGSFTGIRIGLSTILGFAYSLSKKVVGVTTLEVFAYNDVAANGQSPESIVTVMDGSNGTMYIAAYDENINELLEPKCLSTVCAGEFLQLVDEPYAVVADELVVKALNLENFSLYKSDGIALCKAVLKKYESVGAVSYNNLSPLYIRQSQAERDKL